MSYLGAVRLHFAGRFQADPSTINNDPTNYDVASFQSGKQPDGSWNPEGTGAFRLVGCKVTRVCYSDGTSCSSASHDPVVGMWIADSGQRVSGKIVDLDPEQQLVSMIWGLTVRLSDGQHDHFCGRFDPAAFSDLWRRAQHTGGGDFPLGAFWQSVIGPVAWGKIAGSRFLEELHGQCRDGLLSIKFNVDGHNPSSTLGRVVGTIGPAQRNAPRRFVRGRHLLPQLVTTPNAPAPADGVGFAPCAIDRTNRKVIADLGNALPTIKPGDVLAAIGALTLGYLDDKGELLTIGTLDPATYTAKGWYESTAGVVEFPADRALTSAELDAVRHSRLALQAGSKIVLTENVDGYHLRADQFVYRMDAGSSAQIELWASQYGEPLAGAEITMFADTSGLQYDPSWPTYLQVGVPESALQFPTTARSDASGRSVVTLTGGDPESPRHYIDGQVYGICYLLRSVADKVGVPPSTAFGFNPSDFVSVLLFDAFHIPARPTWYRDIQPIFAQYSLLYPLMDKVVKLTDYERVAAQSELLALAFGLPLDDPNHMPVTRDLSTAKRQTILRWLEHLDKDGKPALGVPPAGAPAPRVVLPPRGQPPAPGSATGSKSAAMQKRASSRKGE